MNRFLDCGCCLKDDGTRVWCPTCEAAGSSSPVSAGSAVSRDGTDRLCMAVYGRPAEPRDYIGGANAQMLYDAADMIEALRQNAEGHFRPEAQRRDVK